MLSDWTALSFSSDNVPVTTSEPNRICTIERAWEGGKKPTLISSGKIYFLLLYTFPSSYRRGKSQACG